VPAVAAHRPHALPLDHALEDLVVTVGPGEDEGTAESRGPGARRPGSFQLGPGAPHGLSEIAPPPTPEWGIMVAEGANYIISGEWWMALFPGAALMLAVFTFNLLGDGLRDIVDPQRRI
jgi:hypothetical protein